MSQNFYMSIKEFSRLTGIKSDNLRFYDRIGLLSPEVRGNNKYRYYSKSQLNAAYLISGMRGLGVGLDAIKEYSNNKTPEKMMALFTEQDKRIEEEMERLKNMQGLMKMRMEMASEAMLPRTDSVYLEEKKKEPIFMGPLLDESMPDDEAMVLSYDYADQHGIDLDYPLGTMVAGSIFESQKISPILRYYFRTIKKHNAWKPEGLYAVARGIGNCWRPHEIYKKLYEYIREEQLLIIGDIYEEYPLDEMAVQDPDCCHICLSVRVERKA